MDKNMRTSTPCCVLHHIAPHTFATHRVSRTLFSAVTVSPGSMAANPAGPGNPTGASAGRSSSRTSCTSWRRLVSTAPAAAAYAAAACGSPPGSSGGKGERRGTWGTLNFWTNVSGEANTHAPQAHRQLSCDKSPHTRGLRLIGTISNLRPAHPHLSTGALVKLTGALVSHLVSLLMSMLAVGSFLKIALTHAGWCGSAGFYLFTQMHSTADTAPVVKGAPMFTCHKTRRR
eukprot:1139125-Pelagomonas_calceolata.AAC.8